MTNLRDYDRDATLIQKVRDLERQLAAAQAVIDRLCAEIPKYELAIESELLAERADLADAQAVIERLRAELDRKDGLFDMLIIVADDSDDAFYGTLATHFVRDIAQQGIDAPKAQEPYGCEAPKLGDE